MPATDMRLALPSDAAAIARLVNQAFEVEHDFRPGDRTTAAEVKTLIERDAFLIAERDGRVAGAVHVKAKGGTGYFGMLAVDQSQQREGLGRALTQAAEDYCRAHGCTAMTMSTGEERRQLVAWYERLGYRVTAVEVSSNPAFNRPLRIVQMAKSL